MSTCISGEGEYSHHILSSVLAWGKTCTRCLAFVEQYVDPDDKLDQAVDMVARRVIAAAVSAASDGGEEWENYPEVGEYDWRAVADRVAFLRSEIDPDDSDYQAAYQLLVNRAERSWA